MARKLTAKKFDIHPKASESALNQYFAQNGITRENVVSITEAVRSDGLITILLIWGDPPETTAETEETTTNEEEIDTETPES